MSVNQMIAQGFNPGAGMVNAAKIGYEKDQNALARADKSDTKAQQFAMEGLQQAMQLPPEHRAGFLDMWRAQGAGMKINLPPISPKEMEQIVALPGPAVARDPIADHRAKKEIDAQFQQDPIAEYRAKKEVDAEFADSPAESLKQRKIEAQTRKAEADAQVAETKATEAVQKQQAAGATKVEVSELASEILQNEDGIRAVFGNIGGALPSLMGDTVDAEAKIDRLVDMLTLENTSKMTGVLSESDIKILQRAGTTLANKRISEEMAIKEIKRIANIIEKINVTSDGRTVEDLLDQYGG